jgi:hypothetical protein
MSHRVGARADEASKAAGDARNTAGEATAAIAESGRLHARARAMVRAFEAGAAMPESFDALAVDLVRFQAARVPGYGRLCAARGVDPARVARASEAPAVPTDAFKMASVFAFDAAAATAVFRTSGTTIGARGTHAMRDVATYDAAALVFGRAMLAPARGQPPRVPVAQPTGSPSAVLVLGPSAEEAPDSSLAHMCALFARAMGPAQSPEETYFVRGGVLDVAGLRDRVASLASTAPAIVLATSFALVHLLDALGGARVPLPAGSRAMQTGGFKGKSREVNAAELRREVARTFAVGERDVVGEYGMTELSSQLWEATARDPRAAPGVYVEPPWARIVAVHPESLAPVADGEVGIARVEDLANVDSAFAVQTQDRVRRVAGGFELLGRAPGAPPRGCSIALDEMLGDARGAG